MEESDSEFSFVSDAEMSPPRNARVATNNPVVTAARNPRVLRLHPGAKDLDDENDDFETEFDDAMTASCGSLLSFPEEEEEAHHSMSASTSLLPLPNHPATTANGVFENLGASIPASSSSSSSSAATATAASPDGLFTTMAMKLPPYAIAQHHHQQQQQQQHRRRRQGEASGTGMMHQRKWLGRRKQRRFENDHFIGVAPHSAPYDLPFPASPSRFGQHFLPTVHSPPRDSLFKTFQSLQPSLVEVFVAGETTPVIPNKENSREEEEEEKRDVAPSQHHRVSRKVRKVLNHSNRDFVEEMENALRSVFALNGNNNNNNASTTSLGLARFCVTPPVLLTTETPPSIRLHFKSPFYRLLAHGVAQFHGLVSNSFDDGKGNRVMRISPSSRRRARETGGDNLEVIVDMMRGASLTSVTAT